MNVTDGDRTDELTITITADTSAFDAAMRRAIEAVNRFAPYAWKIRLARQRHRSRLVTRNKQRRNW